MKKVAILVDGGFYRKVSKHLWGEKSPEQRCEELMAISKKIAFSNFLEMPSSFKSL